MMSKRRKGEGNPPPPEEDPREDAALELVLAALKDLRFGTVSIVVQDGVVVQVERTEKTRLPR